MASTNRTPNLGLSSWIDTDRPKRMDFVSDNNILDSVLGAHLNDSTSHLTSSEKTKVGEPFKVYILYGTGQSSTNLRCDFTPSLVIAFKIGAPVFEYSNSKNVVNTAMATSQGASTGMVMENNVLTFYQGAVPDTNYFNNMNEEYSQYAVIAFR